VRFPPLARLLGHRLRLTFPSSGRHGTRDSRGRLYRYREILRHPSVSSERSRPEILALHRCPKPDPPDDPLATTTPKTRHPRTPLGMAQHPATNRPAMASRPVASPLRPRRRTPKGPAFSSATSWSLPRRGTREAAQPTAPKRERQATSENDLAAHKRRGALKENDPGMSSPLTSSPTMTRLQNPEQQKSDCTDNRQDNKT